jgi:hypothetical protein
VNEKSDVPPSPLHLKAKKKKRFPGKPDRLAGALIGVPLCKAEKSFGKKEQ